MNTHKITRLFKFGSIELADPNPLIDPEEVVEHYSSAYPQLNNAGVKDNGIIGNNHVFRISTAVGHNG